MSKDIVGELEKYPRDRGLTNMESTSLPGGKAPEPPSTKPRSTDLILQAAFVEFRVQLVILVVESVAGPPIAAVGLLG
jgi:hypothetical protein